MYTQFFGNYLLTRGAVTKEQLLKALEAQTSSHVKLGALAVHEGFMTASEVEQVFIQQTHRDKRFGEIAIEDGYLTREQVDFLLKDQIPDFVLLGQILVDSGVLTPTQLQNLVTDYRSEYEIYELDMNLEQKELINHLLTDIDLDEDNLQRDYITDYLLLLFNDLIRFIGDDFTPLNILKMPEIPTSCCICQNMECSDFQVVSALDMKSDAAISFASRYAKEDFSEFDEYVKASMEDFLNLHNGLFSVNMSNDHSMEIILLPPAEQSNSIFSPGKNTYLFPILYPFGIIHFICSVYSAEQ